MKIAIDGPAGAGKSTAAKALAERLGCIYLDTGAMYRAVTWGALKQKLSLEDEAAVTALAQTAKITFHGKKILFNGEDVTTAIRTPEIAAHVSTVAALPGVRRALVKQQRELAASDDAVLDGRDICSVVLPDADFKFYIDATPRTRAQRRHQDMAAAGVDKSIDEIEADIVLRDKKDSSRADSPLIRTEDAVYLLTDTLSPEEVVQTMVNTIQGERV